ncbi:hypothetical protein GLV98_05350 [Halobacillus litoralis]|uniref:Uncharacterized protein n=1 Tax=Halobacillus litoralis TaxID=45668 RepID=A0A845ECB5_9BACI|nr:hypothetical protein [Halobacillus litoralis]MYL48898.1 hypothetical protein [Halobacillus litoralis]
MWFEREAGTMLYRRHPSHNEGKERQDMRPYGWVHAPIFFSALSVTWTSIQKPRLPEDEPQSMTLASMSLQLWSAAFIW